MGNISTLDNLPQGRGLQVLLKVLLDFSFIFLLDYRIIINMKFLSFGKMCISPVTSIFQIELWGKQENPLSRGIGNFPGRTFLLSGGNLARSDLEHLSLFQSYKQDSVNIEHQLKSKLA